MTLQEIELPNIEDLLAPIPAQAMRLIEESQQRIDHFVHNQNHKIHGFICSDFVASYACLQWVRASRLLAGDRFCEWGCGFGTVALLASLLGFEACGLDVEESLTEQAEMLAADFEIPARFATGSLLPEEGHALIEDLDSTYVNTTSQPAYQDLGWEIGDFDLIYAYPWPGEERFMEDVFEHFAADGALLLTYHGLEALRLHYKQSSQSD